MSFLGEPRQARLAALAAAATLVVANGVVIYVAIGTLSPLTVQVGLIVMATSGAVAGACSRRGRVTALLCIVGSILVFYFTIDGETGGANEYASDILPLVASPVMLLLSLTTLRLVWSQPDGAASSHGA